MMIKRSGWRQTAAWSAIAVAVVLSAMSVAVRPAAAHPHVWVNVETTVLYNKRDVIGLQHRWTFDDMYTAMAI